MSEESVPSTSNETIGILTTVAPGSSRGAHETRLLLEKTIDVDVIHANFDRFLASLQKIVDVKRAQTGDFVLDEITFSAEISGNGEFKLFGSGVGIAATNAVTFTLRRKDSAS